METPMLMMAFLVICLFLSATYVYLAWFKPDRFRKLWQPPESMKKLLGRNFGFLWRGGQSDYALWGTRLIGPLVTAIVLALLIAMLLDASTP